MNADFKLQEMTLGNVCDGALEEGFRDACAEVSGVLDDYERFQASNKTVTARIVLTVDVSIDVESGAKTVATGVDVKRPPRKRAASPVYVRSGVLMVEPTPEQLNLIHLRGRRSDGAEEEATR